MSADAARRGSSAACRRHDVFGADRVSAAFKDPPFDSRVDTWSTIQFPDLNGDGKADLCGRGPDGLHCGLSTGASFDPVTLWQRS